MGIFQNKKTILLIELILIAIVFFLVKSTTAGIKYSAQIAEITCLVLITYLLYRRKSSWKELGLRKPKNWLKAILLTVLCVATIAIVFNFIVQPLFPEGVHNINQGKPISISEMIFQLIFIAIGTAAIGEEMLMRGFVLNNLNEIFGFGFVGTISALILQAAIFAILHSGIQGMVSSGVIGLILGVFYLLARRNLLIVIAAHAVPDIISVITTFQAQ